MKDAENRKGWGKMQWGQMGEGHIFREHGISRIDS
jgi:hypothetical protein